MAKIIAVTGATGSQGGGVVNVLKKTSGWTVRAVTRNPQSKAATQLASEGIEIVQADFDDEASLAKAFEVSNPPPPSILLIPPRTHGVTGLRKALEARGSQRH